MSQLSQQILEAAHSARLLYHRLVIVVGPPRSGKTASLRELNSRHEWPLVNLNLALSEQLLELTYKQRALRVGKLVDGIIRSHSEEVILLDNIEMLFHPDLKQDPLRLLQNLSRNVTVVAAWRGSSAGASLTYAIPEHPEFRRYNDAQATIISTGHLVNQIVLKKDCTA